MPRANDTSPRKVRDRRIYRDVKERTGDGSISPVLDWYVLVCGHLVSRRRSVAADPKKMYCGKCSRSGGKKY